MQHTREFQVADRKGWAKLEKNSILSPLCPLTFCPQDAFGSLIHLSLNPHLPSLNILFTKPALRQPSAPPIEDHEQDLSTLSYTDCFNAPVSSSHFTQVNCAQQKQSVLKVFLMVSYVLVLDNYWAGLEFGGKKRQGVEITSSDLYTSIFALS